MGNGVDTAYFAPSTTPTVSHTCVFVGVMNYLPNVDAVRWFTAEVWPGIRTKYPDAQFQIVGKSPAAEVLELKRIPGVNVVGPVEDIRPWLQQAACVVVPLRIARGIQNKLLEAMACGRPIVSASTPLQGLPQEISKCLVTANSPAEWVAGVSRLFDNPQLAQQLGTAASEWVQNRHRWEDCLAPLSALWRSSHP
jgi:glycosyltransferase involved in cell wall biosynthesis